MVIDVICEIIKLSQSDGALIAVLIGAVFFEAIALVWMVKKVLIITEKVTQVVEANTDAVQRAIEGINILHDEVTEVHLKLLARPCIKKKEDM